MPQNALRRTDTSAAFVDTGGPLYGGRPLPDRSVISFLQVIAERPLHLPRLPVFLWFLGIFLLSPSALSQSNDDCLACHSEPSLSMEKNGRAVALFVDDTRFKRSAHAELECVSCHEGFRADELPHASLIRPVDCLGCHNGEKISAYGKSVHGMARKGKKFAASCVDCHTTHEVVRLSALSGPDRARVEEQTCARCHKAVSVDYMASDHGTALTSGVKGAPTCIDCHGEHDVHVVTDTAAATNRFRQAELCMSCHLDNPDVRAKVGPSAGFISSYESSVHGKAIHSGNEAAATCVDCHGSHQMKKGSNPASSVAKKNIAGTCGGCHGDIRTQYEESIHGQAVAAGIDASATCTDCHGEHGILSPQDESSPVSSKNLSAKVCSPCHGSVRLTEKYGLASGRFESYQDSYHGLAGSAGSVEVANCASCHGYHDIKPSSDPSSHIHKDNLAATCGSCHPGANVNFTRGQVHVIAAAGDDEILYFVSTAYILLIAVVVGGMLLHNALDFVRKSKVQLMYRRGILQRKPVAHRLYLRMSLNERLQHGVLLVSFILLVVTGFALRFPNAWWVEPIRDLSPYMFELRGLLHRTAGVVMVLASLYHVYYVMFVPRGRQLLLDLLPVRSDISEAIGVMKYNLGFAKEKPKLGRFSYIEKSEYWALVWGTVVMALTGVILWFDNTFLGLLTKLWWDVARTVHYYEAWLATLAIIVWHFYFVIFNPDTYPINLAFWKGTLTEAEMEEEHPGELEEIHQQEKALARGEDGQSTAQEDPT